MPAAEIVYNNRDNDIELELRENGVNLPDYSAINRVVVTIGEVVIDSFINPELLYWTGSYLVIKAGLAGLSVGNYRARIETYDADHTNGLVWTESLYMAVRA